MAIYPCCCEVALGIATGVAPSLVSSPALAEVIGGKVKIDESKALLGYWSCVAQPFKALLILLQSPGARGSFQPQDWSEACACGVVHEAAKHLCSCPGDIRS
eukprot:5421129-Amphidinium_carterae.3